MFESPSDLLAYANAYMDSLSEPPRSVEEAEERREILLSLISQMRRFNFHAPKFGIKQLFSSLRFSEKEELLEALPLLEKFTYSLNVRKWTYERAKVAYLSAKLSQAIFESDVLLDYLPYLPHSGEFLKFVEKAGGASFLVFRDLLKLSSGEIRTELLFEDERLVDVKKRRRKGILPTSTATLLASYSVERAVENHWREILEGEKKAVRNYEEVLRYESIVLRYDLSKVYENPELFWELLQKLEEEGFLEEDGSVRADIVNGVRKKRFYRYNKLWRFASSYFSLFLLEYWLYFTPWTSKKGVPLRGFPRSVAEVSKILLDVSFPCSMKKEEIIALMERSKSIHSSLPLSWREAADTMLFKLCPSRGRMHDHVERLLRSLEAPSERARKFMDLLGGNRDSDKDEG